MTPPISKTLSLLLILSVFSIPLSVIAAESLPTADDINNAAQKSRQVSESFFTQTFKIRMQYEYSGRFLNPQDKENLCEAAQRASAEFEQIANDQNNLKKQIEDYQGGDWESLFGQTGLWRRLAADLIRTQIGKAEIDYYLANFCCDEDRRKQALEMLLSRLDRPDQPRRPYVADTLRAKILWALAEIDDKYRPKAEQLFLQQADRSDCSRCEAIKMSMEKIRCLGPSEPNELSNLAQALAESGCIDLRDLQKEILLSLAILQSKYDPDALQNDTSMQAFFTAGQLGNLILRDLWPRLENTPVTDANFESVRPADVELAATSVLHTNPFISFHLEFIAKLAEDERFQTPAVIYTAAMTYRASQPRKAVELFIRASNLQLKKPNVFLGKTAEEIARRAFDFAYREFTEYHNDSQPAIDAFQNYSSIAPDKIDEQTKLRYANLLNHCKRTDEAVEIFDRLADSSQSPWREMASLELLKIKFKAAPEETLPQLRNYVLDCEGQDEQKRLLRLEAMDIYCRAILASDASDSAEQVLKLLDTAEQTPGLRYDLFRAQSFRQLGRLEESARYMSKAVEDGNSSKTLAAQITSEVIDKVELWRQNARDFNQMLLDCNTLAEFAYRARDNLGTIPAFAEVSVLLSNIDRAIFLLAPFTDENDIRWLRPRARLLMAQNKFEQSAELWAKIAELRRNETSDQTQKSYGWWQAKFYELDCLAKAPRPDKPDISHTIEVLLNTYAEIPPPWAEKLRELEKTLTE